MRIERSQKPERSGCFSAAAELCAPRAGTASKASARSTIRIEPLLLGIERSADHLSILPSGLLHAQIVRSIASGPTLDRDALAHLDAVACPTPANENRWGVGFSGPDLGSAVLGSDVESNESVRVAETKLRDDAVDRDRLVGLKENRERVVAECGLRTQAHQPHPHPNAQSPHHASNLSLR